MPRTGGVRWHCPNRDCNWPFAAGLPGAGEASPRCVCGSLMREQDVVPVFRYLDFLHEGRISEEKVGTEKE